MSLLINDEGIKASRLLARLIYFSSDFCALRGDLA